jgi:guanylate kinase
MARARRGKLVVLSGPSGVGKTTVRKRLFELAPVPLAFSVSATTRPPRPEEVDGVDYHFLSEAEFSRRRAAGEFLECFQVFGREHWYGTLLSEVTPSLEAGNWVILDIDVQGGLSVSERYPEAITIFIHPPSLEVLEARLRQRHTETEQAVQNRLSRARHELAAASHYGHQVINDELDRAVQEICDILNRSGD